MTEIKGKCTNRANILNIYDALCEVLGRQNELEYTHNTTLKEEYKDAG